MKQVPNGDVKGKFKQQKIKAVTHDRTFWLTFEGQTKKKQFNLKTFDKQRRKKLISCDMGATGIAVISSDKNMYHLRQLCNS